MKDAQQIGKEENTITPPAVPASTTFTWNSYRIALVAHIKSSLAAYNTLRDFYVFKKIKAMSWGSQTCEQGGTSHAVNSTVEAIQI